ncbi:galactokinase [Deinococcus metalli]|uniref:Galactokinase n=1 Tax=Deinococcus metalli TaxID=1141878 RepID=A0A7W8KF39_9DEIO|nr:galactokinase [Deinococcus metalli]MBB5377034.1 galactokinase [Deinococcus metalli]GHF49415.1 galactokinase [Deinococcus metalli]
MSSFETIFGRAPEATASAPGRVNLLGEHTDYQGGFVLPTAIPQRTTVSVARNGSAEHVLHSANSHKTLRVTVGEVGTDFAPYLTGCLNLCGVQEGMDVYVQGNVPSGGLSSSAALEVAALRALRTLYGLALDDVALALRGVQVEHEFVGVQCGVMDQMASSLADTTTMLLIDTRSLERRAVPFPEGAEVLVIDSGVPRRLAESGYNERRAQVEEASRLLGVTELRDVTDVAALDGLPELLKKRARHVVTENARVLAGLGADAAAFGQLMNASHTSLRDDYEVSHPQVDTLVALLQAHPDIFGARMTGAGFGGAVVALARAGQAAAAAQAVLASYGADGRRVVP